MTYEDEIISALLQHSRHSLETVNFDGGPLPTRSAVPLQDFPKLTNIVLSATQLIDTSTYKPPKIRVTAHGGVDMEESAFGITDWVDLLTFLPP